MKRTNKKGFTIVELVVVIAIIAILAAVLIPTFASLIKRANISKDQQLVRNLNTALIADKAINGKHETMYSALQAVADSGFDVAKINDKKASDNEILWDSVSDVFCYRNGNNIEYIPDAPKAGDVKDYQYWIIASAPSTKYSTYLYKASGETFDHVTTGLDVGNENVTSITYDTHERTTGDPQTVVIRTNSATTELIVNAPDDTVKHYGAVGTVHVINVDDENCYEENGKAAFTQVDSGKYKTTSTADVELLFVSSQTAVSLEIAKGTVDHAHAISEEEANAINNTNPGVIFDYDGNTDQAEFDVYHHVNDEDKIELTTNYNENKAKEVVTEVVNKAVENTVFAGVAVFKSGEATKLMTLEAFRDSVNAGEDYAGCTVKLLDNIDLNGIGWTPIGTTEHPFSGVFDGQNYTIKNYKIRGAGEDVGLALFGCIKSTDDSTFTSTTDLSDFYSATNYTVNLPAEEIFTCVVKNLNVSGADVNTTADGWTAAVVAYAQNVTISNIRLSNSTITSYAKAGGVIGYVPSSCAAYITNCSTTDNVSVTVNGENQNHCAGILSRNDGRAIIANCINNATINCAGLNGGGITGQAKKVLFYNNINNGNVIGNTRASGIATDCSGSVFINCTNNGYIKTNAVYSNGSGSDSSAGIASYLSSDGISVIVNCHNSGTIEGTAPEGKNKIAGIAAGGVHENDKFINNSNTGTLINKADGGKVYDICDLSSVANEVDAEGLAAINAATATDNKYIRFTGETTLVAGDTVTFNGQEKIEFVHSPSFLTLDLSGANKSSFVLMVNDTVVTLKNGGDNSVTISGKGNTVKVDKNEDENITVKNLTILNDDKETASSFNISGNATKLVLKGNGLVNGEIAENATVGRVSFSGNGTFTLTNRGTISHETEGEYGAEHTVATINACNITIYNYGTIEAKKKSNDVCSYALLFYGGANVKFYAYEGSMVKQELHSAMAISGGTTIDFYYQEGAGLNIYGNDYTYPQAFNYGNSKITVTAMN